jgi:hypothetical protein
MANKGLCCPVRGVSRLDAAFPSFKTNTHTSPRLCRPYRPFSAPSRVQNLVDDLHTKRVASLGNRLGSAEWSAELTG